MIMKPQPKQATSSLQSDQNGMVAITITVILMLVISITVLSFAQIVRREQRQALDNQLSSQAFYAAETGINDVRTVLKNTIASGADIPEKTTCLNTTAPYNALTPTVDSTTNTKYNCVLVSGHPKTLVYKLGTSSASTIIPINAKAPATISSIDLSWDAEQTNAPANGCTQSNFSTGQLPKSASWPCDRYGMIRIDLVPMTTLSRIEFMKNTFTAFIYPVVGGAGTGTVSYVAGSNINGGTANQGALPSATCTGTDCKIRITGLNATKYYARVSALYRGTSLTVAANDSNTAPLPLYGAQVMIDSTGQAQDVLRRIQVRVPLVFNGLHADYGVQSTDSMCKKMTTYDNTFSSTSGC